MLVSEPDHKLSVVRLFIVGDRVVRRETVQAPGDRAVALEAFRLESARLMMRAGT